MAVKIEKKIVAWSLVKPEDKKEEVTTVKEEVKEEPFVRPFVLNSKTYRIKQSKSKPSLYVTISDNGARPLEIFMTTKDASNLPWVLGMARVMSAVFRNCKDVSFLVDELQAIFDPAGGMYLNKKHQGSLVAAIGEVLKMHLESLKETPVTVTEVTKAEETTEVKEESKPVGKECPECKEHALVVLDGCATCLECGYSKCG